MFSAAGNARIPLRQSNPHWLMYALVLNWAGDAGAYYVGRAFGRAQDGAAGEPEEILGRRGGLDGGLRAVAGAYLAYFAGVAIPQAIGLTAAANAAGQLGDLAESAMKRGAGVKDSSGLLPGHGGMLDRVDSTLFALPVIYAYLKIVG